MRIRRTEGFDEKFNDWRKYWIDRRKSVVSRELTSLLPEQ